ncbi:ANTAR domain-containing protein [Salinifilum ghardaiensis]
MEQANGVLAEAGGLSPQQTFALLRDYPRANNQHLTDLARSLAERTIRPAHLLAHQPQV